MKNKDRGKRERKKEKKDRRDRGRGEVVEGGGG